MKTQAQFFAAELIEIQQAYALLDEVDISFEEFLKYYYIFKGIKEGKEKELYMYNSNIS